MHPGVTLLLCATCEGENRQDERQAIRDALARHGLAKNVRLAMTDCMGACQQPVSIGLQATGRASYVFAGVRPIEDADDIARTCQTYLDADNGMITDARSCGRLRDCLRARLPAHACDESPSGPVV